MLGKQHTTQAYAQKRFWAFIRLSIMLSLWAHIGFLLLFFSLWLLVYANIASIVLYIWALHLIRRSHQNTLIITIVQFELIVHAILATFLIGYHSGFHFYILTWTIVLFFDVIPTTTNKILRIALLIVVYLMIDYFFETATPIYAIDSGILNILRYGNIIAFVVILAALAHVYTKAVQISEDILLEFASIDELTKQHNRRHMIAVAEGKIADSIRQNNAISLIILDIDHFKHVNHVYGHSCGDLVLMNVADTLKQALRPRDVFARWGGEEFGVLLPNTSLLDTQITAERLRKVIESMPTFWDNNPLYVSITLGITARRGVETIDDLIARADQALYEGKQRGRNQIIVH